MMLSTFRHFYSQDDLARFLIICPDTDLSETIAVQRSVTTDERYSVVSERDICPDLPWGAPGARASNGWHIQQILKLAAAEHVSSQHYVTLDSDILCLRPFGSDDLVINGKAMAGVETAETYLRCYTDSFAAHEIGVKKRRYESSAALLAYERCKGFCGCYFSETPCVLHTNSVVELLCYLTTASQVPWSTTLAQTSEWTEYSLYFQFLESRGLFDILYIRGGCNAVLDLEKSVWHESEYYRESRTYDRHHFMDFNGSFEHGPFVSIQSAACIEAWLPTWASDLDEFYDHVSSWLRIGRSPPCTKIGTLLLRRWQAALRNLLPSQGGSA